MGAFQYFCVVVLCWGDRRSSRAIHQKWNSKWNDGTSSKIKIVSTVFVIGHVILESKTNSQLNITHKGAQTSQSCHYGSVSNEWGVKQTGHDKSRNLVTRGKACTDMLLLRSVASLSLSLSLSLSFSLSSALLLSTLNRKRIFPFLSLALLQLFLLFTLGVRGPFSCFLSLPLSRKFLRVTELNYTCACQ